MATFTLGTDFSTAPQSPIYVNGRMLGAADLSIDQSTLRTRDRSIGEAAGSGVVRGLTVTSSATTLSVADGLGINRAGEPISLSTDVTLQLAIPLAEVSPTNPEKFRCCEPGSSDPTRMVVGVGIYVLTVRPASKTEGNTATAAPPGARNGGGCVATWMLAGVEFRVTALPVGDSVSGIQLTNTNRRNLVAGWCYGVDPLAALPADPFGFDQAYGLDLLTDLTDQDLPLATFSWDGKSVADLDGWSVRRRIVEPEPDSDGWAVLTAARRIADGQARFHQFQDQADELVAGQLAGQVRAWETFPLLPPVGFLPVDVSSLTSITERLEAIRDTPNGEDEAGTAEGDLELLNTAASAVSGPGFNLQMFFERLLAQPGGVIHWEIAEFLLRESWYRPPIVVAEPEFHGVLRRRRRRRRISYYFVWQNMQALGSLATKRRFRRLRRAQMESSRSNLYVVFVANYLWRDESRPPLVSIQSLFEEPTFDV